MMRWLRRENRYNRFGAQVFRARVSLHHQVTGVADQKIDPNCNPLTNDISKVAAIRIALTSL